MFRALRDPAIIDAYRKEFPDGETPEVILRLLQSLSQRAYSERLCATTVFGRLRLTTARDFTQEAAHDAVGVLHEADGCTVYYLEAATRTPSAIRRCRNDELLALTETYLKRLLSRS